MLGALVIKDHRKMEMDHSSGNLLHILFHLGMLSLVGVAVFAFVLIMTKVAFRKSKIKGSNKTGTASLGRRRKKRKKNGRKQVRNTSL